MVTAEQARLFGSDGPALGPLFAALQHLAQGMIEQSRRHVHALTGFHFEFFDCFVVYP
jgi:hypothetical protein